MPRAEMVLMGPAEMALTRILLRAQFGGEVADFGFERGFGDAHDVVIFHDARGAEIGEGHDGAAVGHQRRERAGDGD